MYKSEFDKIWDEQKNFHKEILTKKTKKEIYNAIFYQRPLKSQKHLVGNCELEVRSKRAPWALLNAQRFRYLKTVNNLRIIKDGEDRELDEGEREKLIKALETRKEIEFPKMRKLLNLKSAFKFNLETAGEKRIFGNKTG